MVNIKDMETFKISKEDILCELENSRYKGRYKIYNTYLEQDEDKWYKDKHNEFEQSLVDNKLYYFAYIKFYLDNDKEYALVAGKSGSRYVNDAGSDVRFRVYPEKGEAKEWLYKNNKQWCQTEILIIRTIAKDKQISNNEALEIEKYLVKIFGLLES